ncbi:hypothetical protein H6F67_11650 [Microcoleus sp. FACHB-1515]|uniref:hypothetical protein n=1 Tax=Cyanophyceae TaxID=3028117 RepID=UPI0016874D9D|nr:hypothetical protein [Microcoleus sp. FACHB-1515]MBD2090508.1 hypothetical protein [Microcoleus sp. FACHB-1515]
MMCTSQPPKADRSLPPVQSRSFTDLVFDELTLFESVSEQYQHLGMRVQGAIAIHPSNSAFQPPVDAIALMPEAGNVPIEITFERPVWRIVAIVNGARQIRMTGFDRHSNVVAHERTEPRLQHSAELPTGGETIAAFPWHTLAIEMEGLSRIVFSSDAPFLLQSLSYS